MKKKTVKPTKPKRKRRGGSINTKKIYKREEVYPAHVLNEDRRDPEFYNKVDHLNNPNKKRILGYRPFNRFHITKLLEEKGYKFGKLKSSDLLIGRGLYGVDKYSRIIDERTKKAFVDLYETDSSVVFMFPSYHEIPASKYGIKYAHRRFYKSIVNLLSDQSGVHPRVLSPSGEIGDKKRYDKMKKKDFVKMAKAYDSWLEKNIDTVDIVFGELRLIKEVFPEIKFETSHKKCAHKLYTTIYEGKKLKVMVIPTMKNYAMYEEKPLEYTAELIEAAKNFKARPPLKNYKIIYSEEELQKNLDFLADRGSGYIAIDIETTGLYPVFHNQQIISAAFSDGEYSFAFLVNHPEKPEFDGSQMLRNLIRSSTIPIQVYQNGSFDLKWIKYKLGVKPDISKISLRDTMLIDHWLWEGGGTLSTKLHTRNFSMDKQIVRHLYYSGHKDVMQQHLNSVKPNNPMVFPKAASTSTESIQKYIDTYFNVPHEQENSGTYAKVPIEILLEYNAMDTRETANIYKVQIEKVLNETGGTLPRIITEVHQQQMLLIADMELNGTSINYDHIMDQIKKADRIIKESEEEFKDLIDVETWEDIVGGDVNINSGQQVKEFLLHDDPANEKILYDDLTGKVSTDREHLSRLSEKYPWITHYFKNQKAKKARNTYLIPFIYNSYCGKLYFNLNITGTATGRLSSSSPNLQNIPVSLLSGDDLISIKPSIEAENGRLLFDMDFSSIEVKVLTVYCPDENLVGPLKDGLDAHCQTASLISPEISYEELREAKTNSDKEEKGALGRDLTDRELLLLSKRSAAKSTIFGSIYGMGPYGLIHKTNIFDHLEEKEALKEAEKLIDSLTKKAYPLLDKTIKKTYNRIMDKGALYTVLGRPRRFKHTMPYVIGKITKRAGLVNTRCFPVPIEHWSDLLFNKRPFRQGLNHLVQSTATDLVQMSLYKLGTLFGGEHNGRLEFTVHDSVVGTINEEGRDALMDSVGVACGEYIREVLPDVLKVDIGYSIGIGKKYCG